MDKEDNGDPLVTAKREAIEEMQVLTKRGKRLQKHYTVFVAAVPRAARDAYQPTLNAEHSEWRWTPAEELRARDDLHPVVHRALHDHWPAVEPMLASC